MFWKNTFYVNQLGTVFSCISKYLYNIINEFFMDDIINIISYSNDIIMCCCCVYANNICIT